MSATVSKSGLRKIEDRVALRAKPRRRVVTSLQRHREIRRFLGAGYNGKEVNG